MASLGGITAANLVVEVGADISGAMGGLTSVGARLTSFGSSAVATGSMLTAGLTLPIVGVGVAAVTAAADFQTNMNLLQSVTQATDEDMQRLSSAAMELGADITLPGTSAADAGEAMLELSKAGLSVNDVLGASRGVLELSAAGQLSNADAAEIAANALNTFHLEGSKASDVANLLAAAANASSVEVKDVADSFKMAGAVFSAFQAPAVGAEGAMVELTTAIALLGNAGIKGSDAGTSLKQMLLQLTGPSQKAKDAMRAVALAAANSATDMGSLDVALTGGASDRGEALEAMSSAARAAGVDTAALGDIAYTADGRMRSLPEIIDLVTRGTAGMTEEQRNLALTTIFGADATRAVIALMQAGPDAFDKMTAAVTREGAAHDMANARMKGFSGAVEGLRNSVESFLLAAALPLLDTLESIVRNVAANIPAFDSLSPSLVNAALAVGAVLAALGPMLIAIGTFAIVLGFALSPLGLLTIALSTLAGYLATHPALLAQFRAAAEGAFGWLATVALPALQAALATALPILESAMTWLFSVGFPAVLAAGQAVFGWLSTVGLPLLLSAWASIAPTLSGGITWLATIGFPTLLAAGQAAFGWLAVVGIPSVSASFQALLLGAQTTFGWLSTTGVPAVLGAFQQLQIAVSAMIGGDFLPAFALLSNMFDGVLRPAILALAPAVQFLAPQFTALVASVQALGAAIQVELGPILTALGPLLQQLGILAQTVAPIVGGALVLAIQGLVLTLRGAADVLTVLMPLIGAALAAAINVATLAVATLNTAIRDFAALVTAVSAGDLPAALTAIRDLFLTTLGGLPALMGQVGRDIVTGIIAGVLAAAPALLETVRGLAGAVVDATAAALGIRSPSTAFAELGDQSIQGYVQGLEAGSGDAADALSRIMGDQLRIFEDGSFRIGDVASGIKGEIAGFALNSPTDAAAGWHSTVTGGGTAAASGNTVNVNSPLTGDIHVRDDSDINQIGDTIMNAIQQGANGAAGGRGSAPAGGSGGGDNGTAYSRGSGVRNSFDSGGSGTRRDLQR